MLNLGRRPSTSRRFFLGKFRQVEALDPNKMLVFPPPRVSQVWKEEDIHFFQYVPGRKVETSDFWSIFFQVVR